MFCSQTWNVSINQWQRLISASCTISWGRRKRSWGCFGWGWNNQKANHSHTHWPWWLWDRWDFNCSYQPEHLHEVLRVALWLSPSIMAGIWEQTSQENNMNMHGIFFLWCSLWSHTTSLSCILLIKVATKIFLIQREETWALPTNRRFVSLTVWKLHVRLNILWRLSLENTICHMAVHIFQKM